MSEKHTPGMPESLRLLHVDGSEANARLIVAAVNSYAKHCGERAVECAEADLLGELLEACKEARSALEYHVEDHPGDRAAWQAVDAAIAKAEDKPCSDPA